MVWTTLEHLLTLLIFPGGLFVVGCGLLYMWLNGKLIARMQNRIGPRWFQPAANTIKLLVKEEITPSGVDPLLFNLLPVLAAAGALSAALYVPLGGTGAVYSAPGDLVITLTLLGLLTLMMGLAGTMSTNRFSLVGATRTLTQLFSYEVPFLLALLGPAVAAGTWRISGITAANDGLWMAVVQPVGFIVALLGLMGKLELHPFDAPEAETEIVAGALTEYSGRGLALFYLSRGIELVVGLTLVAALFLDGIHTPWGFLLKTIGLLFVVTVIETLMARLRIDQTVSLWWQLLSVGVLIQLLLVVLLRRP